MRKIVCQAIEILPQTGGDRDAAPQVVLWREANCR
jgi:hypothetical protein